MAAAGILFRKRDNYCMKNKGVQFIILSAFFFALMNLFVKLSGDLPSIQKSFFRNLVACAVAAVILFRSGEGFRFQRKNLPLLILRSALGTVGILCNYYAVDHLLMSDASMLSKLSPFFVIIFSALFLKEKADSFQKFSVVAAFIGSLFIIKPGLQVDQIVPSLIGFAGAMAAGSAYTCVRGLSQRGERGPLIVFFFSAFSCLVTLPYILLNYAPMSGMQLFYLLMAGASAACAQFSVTAAYSYAPAKEISVFDYSQVIFAAVIGFIAFGQIPDILSLAGYGIIIAIAIALYRHNQKAAQR